MFVIAFIALVVAGTLLAASNWRYGLLLVYVVGILQDPVRKATEGKPAFFVLSFLPIYAAMFLNLISNRPDAWRVLQAYPHVKRASMIALTVIVIGAGLTIANFGFAAVMLIALGFVSYLGPLPAILLGYFAGRGPEHIRRLLAVAVVLSATALIGVLFEYWGFKWPVLGNIQRVDWWHHFAYGGYVKMVCGFFRNSELVGWHGATVAVLGIILFVTSRDRLLSSPWLAVSGWGIVCCLLSGRRKSLAIVVIFLAVLIAWMLRTRRSQLGFRLAIGVALALCAMQFLVRETGVEHGYLSLAATAPGELNDRLYKSTYGAFTITLQQAGVLGYGLGTGAQGSQYLNVEKPRIWQEGGASKIMAELGIPGVVAFLYLSLAMLGAGLQATRAAEPVPNLGLLSGCLFAAFIANAACFIAAHQLFGDPFTLYLLGFLVGLLLSANRLSRAWHVQRNKLRAAHSNVAVCAPVTVRST